MRYHAHILVGDPDAAVAHEIVEYLNDIGYKAYQVSDTNSLIGLAKSLLPDLIIMGNFDNQGTLDIAEELRADIDTKTVPIFLYNCDGEAHSRKRIIAIGVEDMVEAPLTQELMATRLPLLTRLSTMMGELELRVETTQSFGSDITYAGYNRFGDSRFRIMVVAESSAAEADIQAALLKRNIDTLMENNAYKAGDRLDSERCEACVITLRPDDDKERALYLCSHIRNNPRLFNLPVLVIASEGIYVDEEEIYKSGANIALIDNRDLDLIGTYIEILVGRQRARWSMRDPFVKTLNSNTSGDLKGVYSRDFFNLHLERAVNHSQLRQGYMSLCVFSIQNAPDILERFGMEAHEVLLQQMADWIRGLLRIEDLPARIDTHDFAVILTGSKLMDASAVCHRIAGILHHSEFHLTEEIMEVIKVWVQVGVEEINDDDNASSLLQRTYGSLF